MKLIEKLAWEAAKKALTQGPILPTDYAEIIARAYEEGFRKAREMAVESLALSKPDVAFFGEDEV